MEAQSILTLVNPRGSPTDSRNRRAARRSGSRRLGRPQQAPAPNSEPAALTAACSTGRPRLTPNCEIQHCTQTSSALYLIMAGIDARALYGYSDANVKILPSNQAVILAGEPAEGAREETPFSSRPLGWSREAPTSSASPYYLHAPIRRWSCKRIIFPPVMVTCAMTFPRVMRFLRPPPGYRRFRAPHRMHSRSWTPACEPAVNPRRRPTP